MGPWSGHGRVGIAKAATEGGTTCHEMRRTQKVLIAHKFNCFYPTRTITKVVPQLLTHSHPGYVYSNLIRQHQYLPRPSLNIFVGRNEEDGGWDNKCTAEPQLRCCSLLYTFVGDNEDSEDEGGSGRFWRWWWWMLLGVVLGALPTTKTRSLLKYILGNLHNNYLGLFRGEKTK